MKDHRCNTQNRLPGEMKIHTLEIYKNYVILHGCHIHKTI